MCVRKKFPYSCSLCDTILYHSFRWNNDVFFAIAYSEDDNMVGSGCHRNNKKKFFLRNLVPPRIWYSVSAVDVEGGENVGNFGL